MTAIEQRYKSELNAYDSLRSECNARVVKWVYSAQEIWSPWPARAHLMKPDSILPGRVGAAFAWGYDNADQPTIARRASEKWTRALPVLELSRQRLGLRQSSGAFDAASPSNTIHRARLQTTVSLHGSAHLAEGLTL